MAFQSDRAQWWCNTCSLNITGEAGLDSKTLADAELHCTVNQHEVYYQNWFGRSRFKPVDLLYYHWHDQWSEVCSEMVVKGMLGLFQYLDQLESERKCLI